MFKLSQPIFLTGFAVWHDLTTFYGGHQGHVNPCLIIQYLSSTNIILSLVILFSPPRFRALASSRRTTISISRHWHQPSSPATHGSEFPHHHLLLNAQIEVSVASFAPFLRCGLCQIYVWCTSLKASKFSMNEWILLPVLTLRHYNFRQQYWISVHRHLIVDHTCRNWWVLHEDITINVSTEL